MQKTKEVAWAVYKLARMPQLLGKVRAMSEKEALQRAFEECDIREVDRFRISVRQT